MKYFLTRSIEHADQAAPLERDENGLAALDLETLLSAARRQFKLVLACAVVGTICAIAYLAVADPVYTASARVLIDPANAEVGESDSRTTELGLDAGLIESQVELVSSEDVLGAVVDELDLTNEPQFAQAGPSGPIGLARGMIGSAVGLIRGSPGQSGGPDAEYQARRDAIGKLQDQLSVGRVGQTYILQLNYTAATSQLASQIVNALANAFIDDQLAARSNAARRAGEWMETRIAELREKSIAADQAVQEFRAEHNLITADGQLVGDQRLTQLNTQLSEASAERASAQARYESIRSILETRDMNAAVSESLESPVINELRTRYLEASKREADLSARLGPDHASTVRLREEMAKYEEQIFSELERIAQSYKSDLDIAEKRVASLQQSMDEVMGNAEQDNKAMVTLRELARESETTRTLYESFLQRYQEVIQQQSFPMTEARVVAEAAPPTNPSGPEKALTLMLFTTLGGIFGAGVGTLREFREHGFRSGAQVGEVLGQEFIGFLPRLPEAGTGNATAAEQQNTAARATADGDPGLRHVVNEPMSLFSETLRSARVAADLMLVDRKPKIIGVVSALPGEGKTTVAKNFASTLAVQGARTLLIDGDLRNPGLTRAVAPHAQAGLLEAVEEAQPLKDLYLLEQETKLVLLPAVIHSQVAHSGRLLSSERMSSLLTEAGGYFDYIVVDLPPLGPLADVRAAAHHFDAFLLAIEWGRTPRKVVKTALAANKALHNKCLGVVLNKVEMKKQHLYDGYTASAYYGEQYADAEQRAAGKTHRWRSPLHRSG